MVVALLMTVAFLIAMVALGFAIFLYFDTKKKLSNSTATSKQAEDNLNKLLQAFAQDVDKKFLYYIHDPNQILDLTDGGLDIKGTPQVAKIKLGSSAIMYDPTAQTLSVSPSPSGSKILLTNDYVDLSANGNRVKIGNHFLKSNGASLQVCNADGTCKNL